MTEIDRVRTERLQKRMRDEGLEALICRLPENVAYLTEYWPHHGLSVTVMPAEGRPALLVPEVEEEYTRREWADVTPFGWGLLKDGDLYETYRRVLRQAIDRFGLQGKKIGFEGSFEVIAPSYRVAEPSVPSGPWRSLLASVTSEATLVDATDFLQSARAIKSPYELEKLRVANEIAEMGLREALDRLEPGLTEVQVGAIVEYKIRADGPGYKGARLVRAEAEVGAGAVDSAKGTLLVPSSTYRLREGDLVMIELATMVDGYFSDLTCMAVAGEPSARQREIHNRVLEAEQAAARELVAGRPFEAPDWAARQVLKKAGLDQYFVHITGHGVGHRYHEAIPVLAPGSIGTLEENMVSSIEPGVYIPGFGGLRIEDNVGVGASGPIFLSTPRKPW